MATVLIRIVGEDKATTQVRRVGGALQRLETITTRVTSKTRLLTVSLGRVVSRAKDVRREFGMMSTALKWYGLWWGLARLQRGLEDMIGIGIDSVKQYELTTFALQNLLARQLRETTAVKERIKVGEQRISLTQEERLELERLRAQLDKIEAQKARLAGKLIWAGYKTEADRLYDEARLRELTVRSEQIRAKIAAISQQEGRVIEQYRTVTKYTISQEEALRRVRGESQKLYGWLTKVAILSPYSKEGVKTTFLTAMAYGLQVDKAKELTKASLDWAAAMGEGWETAERIVRSLGQMVSRGKLTMEEVRELSHAGVPVSQWLKEFVEASSSEELYRKIRKGQVDAEQALEYITRRMEETYGGTIERMATTLPGLIDSIKDIFRESIRPFAQGIIEPFKPVMEDFVQKVIGRGVDNWLIAQEQRAKRVQSIVQSVVDLLQRPGRPTLITSLATILKLEPNTKGYVKLVDVIDRLSRKWDRLDRFIQHFRKELDRHKSLWDNLKKKSEDFLDNAQNISDLIASGLGIMGLYALGDVLRVAGFASKLLINRFTILTGLGVLLQRAWRTNFWNIRGLIGNVIQDIGVLKDKFLGFLRTHIPSDWRQKLGLDDLKNIDLAQIYDKAKQKLSEIISSLSDYKERAQKTIDAVTSSEAWGRLVSITGNIKDNIESLISYMGKFADEWSKGIGLGGETKRTVESLSRHTEQVATHLLSIIDKLTEVGSQGEDAPAVRFFKGMIKWGNLTLVVLDNVIGALEKIMSLTDKLVGRERKEEEQRNGTHPGQRKRRIDWLELGGKAMGALITYKLGSSLVSQLVKLLSPFISVVQSLRNIPTLLGRARPVATTVARGASRVAPVAERVGLTGLAERLGLGTIAGYAGTAAGLLETAGLASIILPLGSFIGGIVTPWSTKDASLVAQNAQKMMEQWGLLGRLLEKLTIEPFQSGLQYNITDTILRLWEKVLLKKSERESFVPDLSEKLVATFANLEQSLSSIIPHITDRLQEISGTLLAQKVHLFTYKQRWHDIIQAFSQARGKAIALATAIQAVNAQLAAFRMPKELEIHSPSEFEISLMRSARVADKLAQSLRDIRQMQASVRQEVVVNIRPEGFSIEDKYMAEQISSVLSSMLAV